MMRPYKRLLYHAYVLQLLQKLAEAKDENELLSQALQDLQVGRAPHPSNGSRLIS